MRKQLPKCDLAAKRVSGPKIRQIIGHRQIEIDFASLSQLHDPDGGEKLGDGAGSKNRLWIVFPVSMSPNYSLIAYQRDGDRRYFLIGNFAIDERGKRLDGGLKIDLRLRKDGRGCQKCN